MTSVHLRRSHLTGVAALLGLGAILLVWSPWSASANTALTTSNVAVNCEPRQQAVVRQTILNGELQVNIQCVNGVVQPTGYSGYVDEYGRPLPAPMNGVATLPAVYAPQPRLAAASYAPRSGVRQAPAPRTLTSRSKRSWQKTALVIGGSAGAGAGVGALIGGKKGALIGAAIGGGSASLLEALKRDR
jgi:hypothetical protein